jgi:hypothetical protein
VSKKGTAPIKVFMYKHRLAVPSPKHQNARFISPENARVSRVTVIPTYSHLELHAMRERISSRLCEFGIRAQLPKLELPKLAALADLIEANVQQSDTLGRRWLKNVLLGLVLLLETWLTALKPQKESAFIESRAHVLQLFLQRLEIRVHRFCGHPVRVLWCCFRN